MWSGCFPGPFLLLYIIIIWLLHCCPIADCFQQEFLVFKLAVTTLSLTDPEGIEEGTIYQPEDHFLAPFGSSSQYGVIGQVVGLPCSHPSCINFIQAYRRYYLSCLYFRFVLI
jgi:hypothetical protein